RGVVYGHLGRAVNLKLRIQPPDEIDEAKVLNDGRVDAAVDGVAEKGKRLDQLVRLDEHVEREIDAAAAAVRDAAGLGQLLERELRALVARIETLRAEVHGVGAVGNGRADGVQGTCRRQQLG